MSAPSDHSDRRLEALEGLALNFAASQAKQDAQFVSIGETLVQLREDAREARDGVRTLAGTLAEQKFGERISDLSAKLSATLTELRSDMTNAIARTRTETATSIEGVQREIEGLDDRLATLENARNIQEGGNQLIKAMKDWGAWVIASLAGAMAIYEAFFKAGGHHP